MRIINFHGIGSPRRELEPGEARYWIEAGHFCDILDRIAGHPDRELLRITFDDGNISDVTIAAPKLRASGLQARFFVLAGRIGKTGSLAAADIRELSSKGMSIGSHGVDHVDWTSLPARQLDHELRSSKASIEDALGAPVRSAAIPLGRYNAAVIRALRAAGYDEAYSSDGGSASPPAYLRPRRSIVSDMSDQEVEDVLAGRMLPAKRLRRWVGMVVKQMF